MSATAFNFGRGKLHTTSSKTTINGGSAVAVSLPKCSVCVISYSTTYSSPWNRDGYGVISGSAKKIDSFMTIYNNMTFWTYIYSDVAESTTIDFGICPWRVDVHVTCIK